MRKSIDFHKQLISDLQDPAEAAAYLNAALEDGDNQLLLMALKNVVQAHGGMSKLARQANLNRANLYQMLSRRGNPRMQSLGKVLSLLGMKISIVPEKHKEK